MNQHYHRDLQLYQYRAMDRHYINLTNSLQPTSYKPSQLQPVSEIHNILLNDIFNISPPHTCIAHISANSDRISISIIPKQQKIVLLETEMGITLKTTFPSRVISINYEDYTTEKLQELLKTPT